MNKKKWEAFDTFVKNKMDQQNIAGVAVAVSHNGEIIYKKGFGYGNVNTKESITPETIFGIASITKSFTALGIMMLEEKGHLSVEEPVTKYLPEFNVPGIDNMEEIKIYHLLSHTTGLAPMERKEELYKLKEHLGYFSSKKHELLGKPGEYFSYCNDTFILLGAIIERITGKLFRRYITENILNPLKMYRSTMSLEEVAKYDNITVPYDLNNEKVLEEKPWPKLGNYEVGGGIRSTTLDLLKYGELYINKGFSKGGRLLSYDSLKKMWEKSFPILENSYYGYAFKVTSHYDGNMTLVEHGGGQPGVSSNFGFIPEENLVVSVLCNVSNVAAQDVWLGAVNTALNLPIEKKRLELQMEDISPEELERYIGKYDCAEGGAAEVLLEDNEPKIIVNNETLPLKSGRKNVLIIEKTRIPVQFYFKDENAWAMLLGSRMLVKRK
ncbi:CubicO group peptidase (beta-lactamase class C family) [Evansella vedderi]|uniref:CubicO group peptidase (Beta-lactamase class C family) n=1 Tax=Evansella vedderi TaxID=38282 RepID=A0ABT9ZV74_9BACI|nr:serine hydrolase domain-containing protein [Evansella vedderi]MDQ0255141.1 CubicO group peptidase (beta-lactamase class C family) [Evansella vedderi]